MGNRKPPLPKDMTSLDRWVLWKPFRRRGTWSKMPIQCDGSPASSTDSTTWTAYSAVKDELRKGFVLGGGIGCIDLDDCLDDGQLADWAGEILNEYAGRAVWVEVSPSGRGLHIFLPLEPGRGRVVRDGDKKVEVYPPDSGRFICVTGNRFRF